MTNPFIYGRPVRNNEFINRISELSTVFNRIHNGESSALVGEPHIGKTSFLLHINEKSTQQMHLEGIAKKMFFKFMDLHYVDTNYSPNIFWDEALTPIRENPGNSTISRKLQDAAIGYDARSLEKLFIALNNDGKRLVLLLDEFETLLIHPNFREPTFFALLRSLSTRIGSLSYITATRISVSEMNQLGRGLLDTGSPFFNNVIRLQLKPFSDAAIKELFQRGNGTLSEIDQKFIISVAGHHPYLLQALAGTLSELFGNDRHTEAAEVFYERIAHHFDDVWNTMDDHTRTVAIILSLVALGGDTLGQSFSFGEIERVKTFSLELRKLHNRGLIERIGNEWEFDWQNFLFWQGERWTISTQAFAWWVRDVVIAETRKIPTYEEWLSKKCYKLFITQEQWDFLNDAVKQTPQWITQSIGTIARQIVKSIIGKSTTQ